MSRKLVVLAVLLVIAWANPAQADSRSATVRISCTIPPAIGLRNAFLKTGESLSIYSNLEKNVDVTESWASGVPNPTKILTLTAR